VSAAALSELSNLYYFEVNENRTGLEF